MCFSPHTYLGPKPNLRDRQPSYLERCHAWPTTRSDTRPSHRLSRRLLHQPGPKHKIISHLRHRQYNPKDKKELETMRIPGQGLQKLPTLLPTRTEIPTGRHLVDLLAHRRVLSRKCGPARCDWRGFHPRFDFPTRISPETISLACG